MSRALDPIRDRDKEKAHGAALAKDFCTGCGKRLPDEWEYIRCEECMEARRKALGV